MPITFTEHDRRIAESVTFRFVNPEWGSIVFQFPPKILSDNRKGTWEETQLPGVEPVAVYTVSGPREMTLTWTYIVESAGAAVGPWTIDRIKTNVNRLRGYFAQVKDIAATRKNLIVMFKHTWLTGEQEWSCRIKSVNVKHSENLVGEPGLVYPLRTDITVDLRLWTTGQPRDDNNTQQTVQAIPELSGQPVFSDLWY